ncbi:MAG: CatA-like O-acetyltransferase [Ignavibacteriales bacterium]
MKKINVVNWERKKQYEWFKDFSNPCYDVNVRMDVTKLVEHTKKNNQSFFINMLYIVVKGLNSVEEMKMRLVDGEPVVYDYINPAYTVLTNSGTFENVRHQNYEDYKEFYSVASTSINNAKEQLKTTEENYNPENCWDEYYITCLPWLDFSHVSHPMPDNKSSQSIPRICWGKYTNNNGKYELTLNITVSHLFVDGYPLSKTFIKIQELLDDAQNILK